MKKFIQDICKPIEAVPHKTVEHDHKLFPARHLLKRKSSESERNVEVDPSAAGGVHGEQGGAGRLGQEGPCIDLQVV